MKSLLKTKVLRCPAELKKNGRQFWRQVHTEFEIAHGHDLERLVMAAKCLDDIAAIEHEIGSAGRFVKNRYGNVTEHPGCKSLRDTRLLFVKVVRELGLDLTNAPPSRPPGRY